MIKGSNQEEDITIINIYALNIGINSNTIRVEDFNMPLTPTDRSAKQKISKETQSLNDTMDPLVLMDIYRTFHHKTTKFTFFSRAHGTFSRIDHILCHESILGKVKIIKIISTIFFHHNELRLDVNFRKKKLLKIKTYGG